MYRRPAAGSVSYTHLVIDSIGALLGKRVSRDLVRSGAQKGFVSAVFTDLPRALRELLDELALSGCLLYTSRCV